MIYYNTSFQGHYPVGTSAIVCADSPEQAATMLENILKAEGLEQIVPVESMIAFSDNSEPSVLILNNGNY